MQNEKVICNKFSFAYDSNTFGIHDIDLTIQEGEFIVLTGKSGCGKTTLTRCINGLIPDFFEGTITGSCRVCGMDISEHETGDYSSYVGSVFQDPRSQFFTLHVKTEIPFPSENLGTPSPVIQDRFRNTVKQLNISNLLIVMVIIMFRLNVWLALACIIPIIVGFTAQFSMMFGSKAQEGLKEYYDALENISTSSVQYVRGMPSIKIFGQTVHSFRKFYQDIMSYRDFSTKYADNYEPVYCVFRVLVLSLATFILTAGIFFLSGDPENVAFAVTLLFFLIFAPGIATPVFKFNSLGSSMNNITEGVIRIDEIMSEVPIAEPSAPKKPDGYAISFDHVSFSYGGKDSPLVLKDVSFEAGQGQITALVGPSGSGKSTIAQLIPRFWDVPQGKILIGGVDIRDIKTEDLMNTMSFVFQDSFLFSDTLYNNIAVGKPGATKEEVYAAAKAAQCHEFIEKLPKGYDTLIGEGGVYLSGGEEQRVAVARAILKNAPILILDEATAYADPENEYQMQLALQELIKNKTVLIIAHRLITIKNANKIEVINGGKIEAEGTHDELLQKSKTYSAMWDAYTLSSDWQISKKKEVAQA